MQTKEAIEIAQELIEKQPEPEDIYQMSVDAGLPITYSETAARRHQIDLTASSWIIECEDDDLVIRALGPDAGQGYIITKGTPGDGLSVEEIEGQTIVEIVDEKLDNVTRENGDSLALSIGDTLLMPEEFAKLCVQEGWGRAILTDLDGNKE